MTYQVEPLKQHIKPRICITAPLIYTLFNDEVNNPFGGFEVRLSLIARELARRGNFEVCIVVGDFGQPHIEKIEGIMFYSWQGRSLWGVENLINPPTLFTMESQLAPAQRLDETILKEIEVASGAPLSSSLKIDFQPLPDHQPVETPPRKTELPTSPSPTIMRVLEFVKDPGLAIRDLFQGSTTSRGPLWARLRRINRVRVFVMDYLKQLFLLAILWVKRLLILTINFFKRMLISIIFFFKRMLISTVFFFNRMLIHVINFFKRIFTIANLFENHALERIKLKKKDVLSTVIAGYPITHSMISIYDEVDAEIYIVPGNSQYSAEVAFYCKQRDKKFVFLGGSDFDYYPEYKKKRGHDMYGVPYSMKVYSINNSHFQVVQNQVQQEMLRSAYGISSEIIRNPVDLTPLFPRSQSPRTILWVGKSTEAIKQPSLVLRLARELPEYPFVIIMNQGRPETHEKAVKDAAGLLNVTLIEKVPFKDVERYYADARLHVNTSVFEGFPNTFLQAAKYGVPTVSLQVNPGEMLSRHGCGMACDGDFDKFKQNVCVIMENNPIYRHFSQGALEYVHRYHDKEIVIPQLERVLYSVLEGKR